MAREEDHIDVVAEYGLKPYLRGWLEGAKYPWLPLCPEQWAGNHIPESEEETAESLLLNDCPLIEEHLLAGEIAEADGYLWNYPLRCKEIETREEKDWPPGFYLDCLRRLAIGDSPRIVYEDLCRVVLGLDTPVEYLQLLRGQVGRHLEQPAGPPEEPAAERRTPPDALERIADAIESLGDVTEEPAEVSAKPAHAPEDVADQLESPSSSPEDEDPSPEPPDEAVAFPAWESRNAWLLVGEPVKEKGFLAFGGKKTADLPPQVFRLLLFLRGKQSKLTQKQAVAEELIPRSSPKKENAAFRQLISRANRMFRILGAKKSESTLYQEEGVCHSTVVIRHAPTAARIQ